MRYFVAVFALVGCQASAPPLNQAPHDPNHVDATPSTTSTVVAPVPSVAKTSPPTGSGTSADARIDLPAEVTAPSSPNGGRFSCDRLQTKTFDAAPIVAQQRHLLRHLFVVTGYRPDGVGTASVLDLRTMKWQMVREEDAPRFIDGPRIWSPQQIALDTRIVLFGSKTIVLDAEKGLWHSVTQPADLGQTLLGTVGDVLITSTHRLDARALVYRANGKGMQVGLRKGSWRGFFYQWNDGAPVGEKLDVRTGAVTPISLDGIKSFSTTAPPRLLEMGKFFVWGQTSGAKSAGTLFDLTKETWTSVNPSGGPDFYELNLPDNNVVVGRFFVHRRTWYQDPLAPSDGAAKEQDTLYVFDGDQATWTRVKTLKEAQIFPIGSWILAIGSGKAWLHDPAKGGRCELPASRFGYGSGQPIHVLADGQRIVFFGSALDTNPRCPPGAPCMAHRPELVQQTNGGIVVTIAP